MTNLFLFCCLVLLLCSCHAQQPSSDEDRSVGGPCENCYELEDYQRRTLSAVDTLPDFATAKQRIKLTGTIYRSDGQTPAEGVILFVYQTNEEGIYQTIENDRRTHYHRGWIKTGLDGRYTFYTFLPGSYPGGTAPRHIHPVIKEPGKTAYYIADFLFDNDSLLTDNMRNRQRNRGGSGIVILRGEGDLKVGIRDIFLGKNIPGY